MQRIAPMRAASLLCFALIATLPAQNSEAATTSGEWPQMGYGSGHTGYHPTEMTVSSTSAADLQQTGPLTAANNLWDPIAIFNGVADGNSVGANELYAFYLTNGAILWTFTGTNVDAQRGVVVSDHHSSPA